MTWHITDDNPDIWWLIVACGITLIIAIVVSGIKRHWQSQDISRMITELQALPASDGASDGVIPVTLVTGTHLLLWCTDCPTRPPHPRAQLRLTSCYLPPFTGWLGAGKTTLINEILTKQPHGARYCVIENEKGSVSVDHLVLQSQLATSPSDTLPEMLVLDNGCMCCLATTSEGTLQRTLRCLIELANSGTVDHVLVEASGSADPAPLITALFSSTAMSARYRLAAVVAMVDAKHGAAHFVEPDTEAAAAAASTPSRLWLSKVRALATEMVHPAAEALRQVAYADVVLLNKADTVEPDALAAAKAAVQRVNPQAHVHTCVKANVDLRAVVDVSAYDGSSPAAARDAKWLAQAEHTAAHHAHGHCASFTVHLESRIAGADLMPALRNWLMPRWSRIYRLKGVVNTPADGALLVQGVHTEVTADVLNEDIAAEALTNAPAGFLVVIGHALTDADEEALSAQLRAHSRPGSAEHSDAEQPAAPSSSAARRRAAPRQEE